jgi:hypothetical protein
VHTFAGSSRSFFIPALATSLWLLARQELFSQFTHMIAVLYVIESGGSQIKLVAAVVDNFVIGQTARSYCANGAGF